MKSKFLSFGYSLASDSLEGIVNIYCRGAARIRHMATGDIYEIESDELDWDAVGGDERQMGPEIHYEAILAYIPQVACRLT